MRPKGGTPTVAVSLALAALSAAACAHPNSSVGSASPANTADKANVAEAVTCNAGNNNCDRASIEPMPDPRVGLKAGGWDAGQAEWNMHLVANGRTPEGFVGKTNSDLAFLGNYVIQGNYQGFLVWDISNPTQPTLKTAYVCPASQSDVSVYKNLMFESSEAPTARLDCGADAPKDTVSLARIRGVRIWDISDIEHPKNIANVQTCRGSHTHTLLVDPKDPDDVYIYISGSAGVRSPSELAGCVSADPEPGPQLGQVPDRGHQGPARASRASGDRELAAHLRGTGARGNARPSAAGCRRRGRSPCQRRVRREHWGRSPDDRASSDDCSATG